MEPSEQTPLTQGKKSYRDTYMRWVALFLACIFQMGNYYCYDFPAVLQDEITAQFHVSSFQYNLLYTVYSLPNIILPLVGGILIDRIGVRTGIICFPIFLMIGQALCVLGSMTNQYYLLIIGRTIFGLGGENNSVVQSTIVSKWFEGKEIALALGLNITMSRIGSILNSVITPKIYNIKHNITQSLIFGFFFLIFSWLAGCILAYIDKKNDQIETQNALENDEKKEEEKISLQDLKQFKVDFWLVTLSCILCYTNLFVFQQNNISMFKSLYNITPEKAQTAYQIPYYMGSIFTPFIGILIDYVGRRPAFLILAGMVILFVDSWYFFIPACVASCFQVPIVGQITLGIFYVFYAAVLWPTIPLCVPSYTVGTAFGVTNSVQNFGLAIGPLIVGALTKSQSNSSYKNMMLFFTIIAILNLVASVSLFVYDKVVLRGKLSKNNIGAKSQVEDTHSENISIAQRTSI